MNDIYKPSPVVEGAVITIETDDPGAASEQYSGQIVNEYGDYPFSALEANVERRTARLVELTKRGWPVPVFHGMSSVDFREMMTSHTLRLAPTMFTFNPLTASEYAEGESLPVVMVVLPAADIQVSSPLQGSKIDLLPKKQDYFFKDKEGPALDISQRLTYPKDLELENWLSVLRIPYQEDGGNITVPLFRGFALGNEFFDAQKVKTKPPVMWDADFAPARVLELKDGRTIRIARKPIVDF